MNIQAVAQPANMNATQRVNASDAPKFDINKLIKQAEEQKNRMLKLLTTQMQHQNPTKPMSIDKIGQQLAAFGTVKQQQVTNQLLKTLILTTQGLKADVPQAHIGKSVVVKSDTTQLNASGHGQWFYQVPKGTKSVIVRITDPNGKQVLNKTLNDPPAGQNTVNWKGPNGKDGKPMAGFFKMEVIAVNGKGDQTKITDISSVGKIEKVVVNKDGKVFFEVNGKEIDADTLKFVG